MHRNSSAQSSTKAGESTTGSRTGAVSTVITSVAFPDPFAASHQKALRIARYMVVSPFAYVALTLPLAAGRVSAMTGKDPPLADYCVAGTLMASCGIIDTCLYNTTRKALIKSSVGVKGSGSVNNELVIFRTAEETRRETRSQVIRLDELAAVDEEIGRRRWKGEARGMIIVAKSVTRSEGSFGEGVDKGAVDRSGSMKNLVRRMEMGSMALGQLDAANQ